MCVCVCVCVCVCACVREALDAPSPRLCVCSHGQQGVNPLLSLLLHSWSLGGITALHLSLPGFILIGSTPNLPQKKKKKKKKKRKRKEKSLRVSHLSSPPSSKVHLQKNNPGSDAETPTDVTARGAAHRGRRRRRKRRRRGRLRRPPPVAFKLNPLSPHVTPVTAPASCLFIYFAVRFINMFEVDMAGATERHLNQCPRLPICPLSC